MQDDTQSSICIVSMTTLKKYIHLPIIEKEHFVKKASSIKRLCYRPLRVSSIQTTCIQSEWHRFLNAITQQMMTSHREKHPGSIKLHITLGHIIIEKTIMALSAPKIKDRLHKSWANNRKQKNRRHKVYITGLNQQ